MLTTLSNAKYRKIIEYIGFNGNTEPWKNQWGTRTYYGTLLKMSYYGIASLQEKYDRHYYNEWMLIKYDTFRHKLEAAKLHLYDNCNNVSQRDLALDLTQDIIKDFTLFKVCYLNHIRNHILVDDEIIQIVYENFKEQYDDIISICAGLKNVFFIGA